MFAEAVKHDHVAFIDNQPVLTLIEGKPTGLLSCLDDEAFIGPKGSDDGFLRNVAARLEAVGFAYDAPRRAWVRPKRRGGVLRGRGACYSVPTLVQVEFHRFN